MTRYSPGTPDRPDAPGPADRPERFGEPDRPRRADPPLAPAVEPYQRQLDRPNPPGGDTPRETIRRFDPERANLKPLTTDEAKQHVTDHADDRPWLGHARYVGPDTRRVLAAIDTGGGHALERHGSTVTPELTDRRATHLEDPAISDDTARAPGRDAYKSGRHGCGDTATRIRDPHAFATCFARGIEHPAVREKLDQPYSPVAAPRQVGVPLTDLLGPNGHLYCDGHRLDPVDGSRRAAQDRRTAWVDAVRNGREPDVPEPTATRLQPDDFRDAEVIFAFRPNRGRDGWEVATMYVQPDDDR